MLAVDIQAVCVATEARQESQQTGPAAMPKTHSARQVTCRLCATAVHVQALEVATWDLKDISPSNALVIHDENAIALHFQT